MKPSNLKAGQRWWVIGETSLGDYFDVEDISGRLIVKWASGKTSHYNDETSTWSLDYRLDESYIVERLLKEYETDQ
jgi:hypothetical protein